ncbi:MAG: hypothetical protein NC236_01380 [Mycoplasma sp.]|nr:hypothetical protein [Mycoplasma sp.]
MIEDRKKLSLYGMIVGYVYVVLFIIPWATSGAINVVFWIFTSIAWILGVIIGIFIIMHALKMKEKKDVPEWWLLYLISGIVMILFPIVGAILLTILYFQYFSEKKEVK